MCTLISVVKCRRGDWQQLPEENESTVHCIVQNCADATAVAEFIVWVIKFQEWKTVKPV